MPTPTRLAIIFIALLAALPLQAGVVEHDFLTLGDGLLTYDDVNQREWLDLIYTLGMELSAVQTQMESGGLLEGFEFATLADVEPFALSAEINWSEATSNVINPNLLPNFQEPPSPGNPGTLSLEAENLLDLLGTIFTIRETIMDVVTGTQFTVTDSSTFGQIAQPPLDQEPIFDGTNVSVYVGESLIQFANGTSNLSQNILITTEPNALFPQAIGTNGPFWLYRTAVPEPTSIALLTLGALAVLSTRNRYR